MPGSVNITVGLPLNDTLTNLLIYEGLIYLMSKVPAKVETDKITIPRDGIAKVYSKLDEEIMNEINVSTVGRNDNDSLKRFLDWLGISGKELREKLQSLSTDNRRRKGVSQIKNYRELLYILNRSHEKLRFSADTIFIGADIGKRRITIGDVKGDKGITLQLMKSERYTGLTSTEHEYTTSQLTTYVSPEVLLVAMLGLYSSFVCRNANTYYFLFFSPVEMGEMLSSIKDIEKMVLIKNGIRETLEEVIRRQFMGELILAEIYLSAKLEAELAENNVKSISLLLLRINHEGQTYKVYEAIPLTIFSREARELYRVLEKIIAPGSIVLDRLRNSDNVEHSNLVSAIIGLYRFVILDDKYGIYHALRELHNAYVKVKGDKKLEQRYLELFRDVGILERFL
ncbi:MAG: hypothetical protein QW555_07645 [Nitrososphaerota archaeon]